ncbi:hypothetical protein [Hathewaya massiliensis]|uniref:hypothetical protein n=1 Tax=Hathewaya massiliensis TaxID=1964382 RepID=UPI001158F5DC|nr:hypothetical protein [Hathewaya massiliensis]
MIKINLNSEKKKKIEEYHLQYANQYIKPNLQKKIKESEKNRKICDFYKKLNCEFENIIIGEPSVLRGLVEYTEEYSCENNLYSFYNEALTELYIQSINKNEVINYIEKKSENIVKVIKKVN